MFLLGIPVKVQARRRACIQAPGGAPTSARAPVDPHVGAHARTWCARQSTRAPPRARAEVVPVSHQSPEYNQKAGYLLVAAKSFIPFIPVFPLQSVHRN